MNTAKLLRFPDVLALTASTQGMFKALAARAKSRVEV